MKLRSLAFLAAAVLLAGTPLAAQEKKAGDDALQAKLKKHGATAHRDEKRPGKPIVAIDLRGPEATDEVIEIIGVQPELEAAALVGT